MPEAYTGVMIIPSLADDAVSQDVLRAFLTPPPAYYATAARGTGRVFSSATVAGALGTPRDLNPGPRRQRTAEEIIEDENWTVINTVSTAVYVAAENGEMPLHPDGFESDYLGHGVKLGARTAAWPR